MPIARTLLRAADRFKPIVFDGPDKGAHALLLLMEDSDRTGHLVALEVGEFVPGVESPDRQFVVHVAHAPVSVIVPPTSGSAR
ncbi:hypothetical protein GS531_00330 [Rhodococcus hoagii]|nr:hypothetical protein [Prescottella equi]